MNFALASLVSMLALIVAFVEGQNPCGSGTGWRYSPHSRRCFKLFNTKVTWTMAEFKCVFQGAHQISIHDLNDNQFLAEMAKQANIVWLGAAQFGSSRDYVWADGTPFIFEHWKNSRRPTYHPGRKCTKFVGSPGEYVVASTGVKASAISGDWLQTCCKVQVAYICAKPATYMPGPIIENDDSETEQQQATTTQDVRRSRLRLR
ncbi:lectin c-type domain-containing protein [Ditylenchus destructor]|uniref:Lectin c-type domain-containing protein n=1 Tax=Ditylenchus destructor TaxID=166010 RepID=A0AAD4MXX6_9BILA|nr:lectin c-type domain-containing protein [Ditylenchus destructor]